MYTHGSIIKIELKILKLQVIHEIFDLNTIYLQFFKREILAVGEKVWGIDNLDSATFECRNHNFSYRSSWTIWCSNIAGTVKMTKVFMSRFTVSTGKLWREHFGAYSVDGTWKITVSNSSCSGFDSPQCFATDDWKKIIVVHIGFFVQLMFSHLPKTVNCGRRVKNNFSSVQPEHQPIQRMMTSITDVDCDSTKRCLIN